MEDNSRPLRKRPLTVKQQTQGELARKAASQVLKGKYPTIRDAASALGVANHSHVSFYLKRWKDTELSEVLAQKCRTQSQRKTLPMSMVKRRFNNFCPPCRSPSQKRANMR